MLQFTAFAPLNLELLCHGIGCAPQPVGPLEQLEHDYAVSLYVSDTLIWISPPRPRLPQEAGHQGRSFREGEWRLCERNGWLDHSSCLNVVAWCWRTGEERHVPVVNLAASRS